MPRWPFHERWEKRGRRERSGTGSSSFMFKHAEEMVGISLLLFSDDIPQPCRLHFLIYASYPSPCGRLFLFNAVLHTKDQNNAGYWLLKTTDLKTSTSNKTRYRSKQTKLQKQNNHYFLNVQIQVSKKDCLSDSNAFEIIKSVVDEKP